MVPEYSAVLLRYGEIAIKSNRTRKFMSSLLVRHLKAALKERGISFGRVRNEFGRIFIETESPMEVAVAGCRNLRRLGHGVVHQRDVLLRGLLCSVFPG